MRKIIILFFILISILFTSIHFNKKIEENRYSVAFSMEDYDYKKSIIKSSKNLSYKLENLKPLVGPEELARFIKENDSNPQIYIPSKENIEKGIYQANLHMHTTNSDGLASVEYLLNFALKYSNEKLNKKPIYVAFTDHNTVLGGQELISVLQKNPHKYDQLKIIAGIEISSALYNSKIAKEPVDIHVLTWCINPYDKVLNKEFYKKDLNDKYNRIIPDRDFKKVISFMSEYGLVGIAHPARYLEFLDKKKYDYVKELLNIYKQANKNNILYLEGYYQAYPLIIKNYDKEFIEFLQYINSESEKMGIYRTGSTDVHGYSIFKK